MKKILSLATALLLVCLCTVGAVATQLRFQVLASTGADIWVEDGEIIFWAEAIPWEPAELSIYMEIEESINGDYETIFTGRESDFSDQLELYWSTSYDPNRYFKMIVTYEAGPDNSKVTKYFHT